MSDSRLPESMDEWPDDPFILLGVHHASSRREVKRAYAQLIRVYKPEHSPEQFRRIRDAYEFLDQRLSWMEANVPDLDEAPPLDLIVPESDALQFDENSPQSSDRTAEPLGDELWQKAREGDLAESYAEGARLAFSGGNEELYVRLFWMLRMAAELDPVRDARDWLIAGMKHLGLRGRLPELYRCELIEDPVEALHSRCDAALGCQGHFGLLTELTITRWGAAAKLERWDVIVGDLDRLRSRLQDDPAVWGRLLLAAIDHLAWTKSDPLRQSLADCREEIEQLAEHWLPIAGELDQRDILMDLVQACDQLTYLTNLPLEWRKSLRALLLASWNQPFEAIRVRLIEVVAALVQNPIAGMEWLDRLEARCSPALHRLGTLIIALANDCGVGTAEVDEALGVRFVEFMIATSKNRFPARWTRWMQAAPRRDSSGRIALLVFCTQESITVRNMMDLLAASQRQDLAQFLGPASSAPLHMICLAYQAFWA